MREYSILFTYEQGVHPVRDVYIDHPEVVTTALAISASPDTGWRVERITGPEHALDALETVYLDPEICNECICLHPACDAQVEYEVLEHEPTTRMVYHSTTEETFCYSVSALAVSTLGDGLVFNATQRGPHYEWRVLIPANRDLGAFHDALQSDLPNDVTLTVRRVGTLEQWQHTNRSHGADIPYEQRKALETAVRLGYYEYPREVTLEDVAAELDLPLTTLRYRLRRAEAWAVTIAQGITLPAGQVADEQDATAAPTTPFDED
ncbi:helix-turn-helix domain-containing protein [Natronococcus wangiae]|uniref:helix-turn-helix domain-containing protein n=1 Tax=Natronococcus wangiae TaxID=3068275 RepID=UPI00273D8AF8|nr:helix-turn-helix domain-containing protein [Natronococcus sp. AD5]